MWSCEMIGLLNRTLFGLKNELASQEDFQHPSQKYSQLYAVKELMEETFAWMEQCLRERNAHLKAIIHGRTKRTIAELKQQLLLLDMQPPHHRALPSPTEEEVRYRCKTKSALPRELLREMARALPFKQLLLRRQKLLKSAQQLGSFGTYLLEHFQTLRASNLHLAPRHFYHPGNWLERFLHEQIIENISAASVKFVQENVVIGCEAHQLVVERISSTKNGQIWEYSKKSAKKGRRSGRRQQKMNCKPEPQSKHQCDARGKQ